jgi:hypothetical protein
MFSKRGKSTTAEEVENTYPIYNCDPPRHDFRKGMGKLIGYSRSGGSMSKTDLPLHVRGWCPPGGGRASAEPAALMEAVCDVSWEHPPEMEKFFSGFHDRDRQRPEHHAGAGRLYTGSLRLDMVRL